MRFCCLVRAALLLSATVDAAGSLPEDATDAAERIDVLHLVDEHAM